MLSGREGDQPVPTAAHASFQSLLGGVAWLVQIMMPIAVYIAYLQRRLQKPLVAHWVQTTYAARLDRDANAASEFDSNSFMERCP